MILTPTGATRILRAVQTTTVLICSHCREEVGFVPDALRFMKRRGLTQPYVCSECRWACRCRGGCGVPCIECQSEPLVKALRESVR